MDESEHQLDMSSPQLPSSLVPSSLSLSLAGTAPSTPSNSRMSAGPSPLSAHRSSEYHVDLPVVPPESPPADIKKERTNLCTAIYKYFTRHVEESRSLVRDLNACYRQDLSVDQQKELQAIIDAFNAHIRHVETVLETLTRFLDSDESAAFQGQFNERFPETMNIVQEQWLLGEKLVLRISALILSLPPTPQRPTLVAWKQSLGLSTSTMVVGMVAMGAAFAGLAAVAAFTGGVMAAAAAAVGGSGALTTAVSSSSTLLSQVPAQDGIEERQALVAELHEVQNQVLNDLSKMHGVAMWKGRSVEYMRTHVRHLTKVLEKV